MFADPSKFGEENWIIEGNTVANSQYLLFTETCPPQKKIKRSGEKEFNLYYTTGLTLTWTKVDY